MKCKLCGRNVKLFENTKYGMCDACCETDEGKAKLQAIADRIKDEKNSRNKADRGTSSVTTGYSDFAIVVGWVVGAAGLVGGVINIVMSTEAHGDQAGFLFGMGLASLLVGLFGFAVCTVLGEIGLHIAALRKQNKEHTDSRQPAA
jgi:Ca2+/Na+ antiporter